LSSNDICMIEHVPEMVEAGINSFKIEGRIKGAYYAAVTTKVYREAVDLYLKDPEGYKTDAKWLELLDKVVHRDYATGFFFDNPIDNAQIGSERTYNKPAFVVGVVEGYDEEKGMYIVSQRNKLYRGDSLNVLKPEGWEAPITASEIYDMDMNPLESVPHPQMKFFMKPERDIDLPARTFLSRDGDKDEGIRPNS